MAQRYPDTGPLAVAARLALVTAVVGVLGASLLPAPVVPRILYSYHLEHFAAFYLLALIAAAACPRLRLRHILICMMGFAAILEGARVMLGAREISSAENLFADIGGVWSAIAPILIGRFRDLFRTA